MLLSRCIIVDDDLWSVLSHKKIVQTFAPHVQTTQFVDPSEAFTFIARGVLNRPTGITTLILLDYKMPEMDGDMFIENLKTLKQDIFDQIRVVVVTSHDNLSVNDEHIHVIKKPLTLEGLRSVLK